MLQLSTVLALNQYSSRKPCTAGDNAYCERYDFEGACCAYLKVVAVSPFSTANETKNQVFTRCYNYDDIYRAFSNKDVLVDNTQGGSLNSYSFLCSEPTTTNSAPNTKEAQTAKASQQEQN